MMTEATTMMSYLSHELARERMAEYEREGARARFAQLARRTSPPKRG